MAAVLAAVLPAHAAEPAGTDTVVITGSGAEQRAFDTPYAVGVVDAQALRGAGPMVNLSEAMSRVPGLVVGLRNNYAQDLQISSRGFGARASFGVRGIRLVADGIPASGPDGQGQVSHFDLAGADRIEVLRGPFSALYGSSSGGVIALVTRGPTVREATLDADAGSAGLRQQRLTVAGPLHRVDGTPSGFDLHASATNFAWDGERPHSEARRRAGNVRLGYSGDADRVVLVLNGIDQPAADPLGLTRAQFDADPRQTAPQARQFDTRKQAWQDQAGLQWQHRFDTAASGDSAWPGLQRSAVAAYAGRRSVTQWQAIPVMTQNDPRHPGGVIDFDRVYDGVDARLHWRWNALRLVAGAAVDRQREDRLGFENFTGSGAGQRLGVTGRLRRDEDARAEARDAYVQADLDLAPAWTASGGVRRGRLQVTTRDRYLANGDDTGALAYRHTLPVAALRWQPGEALSLYASAGRGAENPTLGELAYRPDGAAGLNVALQPQRSRQVELGAKWRAPALRLTADAAVFRADTDDEIGIQSNTGGRSTFQNVGRTRRQGAELSLTWRFAPAWRAGVALSVLDARYRDDFLTCAATPCPAPTATVPAGNRIAGTLPRNGFAELAWSHADGELGVEARGQGRQAVNDLNSDFAAGHGLVALRALHRFALGGGTALEVSARVDNLFDRAVAGSVIVNEANQRWFEPGARRTMVLGVRWRAGF